MTPTLCAADWNAWPEAWTPERIWASAAAIGFDALELGIYEPAEQLARSLVSRYRQLEEQHGLPVATVLFSMPPDRWPEGGLSVSREASRAIDDIVETARVARDAFGCRVLGIWPGADLAARDTPSAGDQEVLVGSLRAIVGAVTGFGMEVAVEYKPGDLLGDARAALRVCDDVDSPAIGVLLDTGHAIWGGEDLPDVVRLLGDRLKHVHLGDTPGAIEADLPPGWHHDFAPFMAAIDEVGYRGAMSLDMYGAVKDGVVGAEAASRFGYDAMTDAARRARADR